MPNYQDGKIYRIKSNETERVYIGSTCSVLKKRLNDHKSAVKSTKCSSGTVKELIKYADASIELIENFPCTTKRELQFREGEIIKETPNCVNTQIEGRTMAEYRLDNADKLKQYSADYREQHREILNKKHKEWYYSDKGRVNLEQRKAKVNVKVVCPICSKEYSKSNLSHHIKTIHEKIKVECVHCNKKYHSTATLNKHIKAVHDKIKDQQCNHCDFKCSEKSSLKRHIKKIHALD